MTDAFMHDPSAWFADQKVLVTGAAGQIGSACARAFASLGATVFGVDRQAVGGGEAGWNHIRVDLSGEAAIGWLFDELEQDGAPVSVVVQCAAVYGRTPFLELTDATIDHVLGVNLRATMQVARRAALGMISHSVHGVIVNLSSTSSIVADAESVPYEASKGAVNSATKGMAVALAPYGIRVVAIAPGSMVKFQEIDQVREPEDLTAEERSRIPLGRLGIPSDIADVATFIASPAAKYMTGTVVVVDGGQIGTYATSA